MLLSPVRAPLSRVRCVPRPLTRPETTGRAATAPRRTDMCLSNNTFPIATSRALTSPPESLSIDFRQIMSFLWATSASLSMLWSSIRNRLVARQLLDIISVIQTGTSHDVIRSARFSLAGRADGSCKFGSITGQTHVVLHALFLQLCEALITETTAVVHDVTSPALISVSFTRHCNKGTQLHNCASDSLTSRWWFSVGVIAAARSSHRHRPFLASLCWTRWSFHCDSASWLRTGGHRAAHHCGTCSGCVGAGLRGSSSQLLRIVGLFSTSVILHFLAGSEVPFHFFGLDIWAMESKTRSLGLIWPHSHTFAELLELCFSR